MWPQGTKLWLRDYMITLYVGASALFKHKVF